MNQNYQFKSNKMLSPKLDVVFHATFGTQGSERITKKFLEAILKRKINKIDLTKNPILTRERKEEKLGILDVIAQINETENCNIEIQLVKKENIIERILYYWSKLYVRELKAGEDYNKLKKTISILIADFEINGLEELKYHSKWKIIEEEQRKIILTNNLEINIIELPKVEKNNKSEDELIDWLMFLINPNSERVKKKMKENEELKEAVEKVQTMSEDEYMQRIADLREKAILDETSLKNEGLRKGEAIGLVKGEKLGFAKGEKSEKIKLAKKMLEEGIPIEIIIKITELTKEEILKLD